MQFSPKSEQQIREEEDSRLLPAGNYDGEILSAVEKKSSKGNDMIELKIKVMDTDGSERTITDYVMAAMPRKLMNFSQATDMIDAYQAGHIPADLLVGKYVQVKLKIEKGTGTYRDKNAVADYVVNKTAAEKIMNDPAPVKRDAVTASAGPGIPEADLPFAPNLC